MKKCPFCGKELPDEMTFCLYCMNKLTSEEQIENAVVKKKNVAPVIIISIVVTLVLIAGVICSAVFLPKLTAESDESISTPKIVDDNESDTGVKSNVKISLDDYLGKDFSEIVDALEEYDYMQYGEDGLTYVFTFGCVDVYADSQQNQIKQIDINYDKLTEKTKYSISFIDGTYTYEQVKKQMGEPDSSVGNELGYYYGQGYVRFDFDDNNYVKEISYFLPM